MIDKRLRKALYYLLAILVVLVFYLIFNAGNPKSIIRFVIKDPAYDVTVTVFLSILIVVISIALTSGKGDDPIKHMLEINIDHIRKLRAKGKSESEIADSFLNEIGAGKGFFYALAKRRVLRYLSKMD